MNTYNFSDTTEAIQTAFNLELREHLATVMEAEIEKFKKERMPALIARASKFVDVSLVKRVDMNAMEVRFVIADVADLRRIMANG